MKWVQDVQAEELMASLGIKYKYASHIPISQLRIEESKSNNARFGDPIDEDHVIVMSTQMESGHSFPAILCTPSFLILGGNQRVAACDLANVKFVDAYIVDPTTTRAQQDELCRKDNCRHGMPNSVEERIVHCVELHARDEKAYPLKKLCNDLLGGSGMYSRLVNAWEAHEVSEALTAEKVDVANFKSNTMTRLRPLLSNRVVLRTAAIISAKCKLNDTQVIELVAATRAASDEASQLEVIEKYGKTHAKKARSSKVTTQFLHSLHALFNFMENDGKPYESIEDVGIDDLERAKEIEAQIIGLSQRLQAIKQSIRELRRREKAGA